MKLFDKQTLTILAIVSGSLITIKDMHDIGVVLQSKVDRGIAATTNILTTWPVCNDQHIGAWANHKINLWSKACPVINDKLQIVEHVSISLSALEDLRDRLKEKKRKTKDPIYESQIQLLEPLYPILADISEFMDPSGTRFEAYENMDRVLYKLETILEIEHTRRCPNESEPEPMFRTVC